jgi:hypothetical protein
VAEPQIRWWQSHRNLGFLGSVAVGLVVAFVLGVFGNIPLGRLALAFWGLLVYPIRVPLIVLASAATILLILAVRALSPSAAPPAPAWVNYREDQFLGVVWRWMYDGLHLSRESIRAYCPQCAIGLRGEEHGGYGKSISLLICDECGFRTQIPGSVTQVLDRICRLIEREINTRPSETQ